MSQTKIFLESEADAWFARNGARLGVVDPVGDTIELLGYKPCSVLEIGCANGWRLKRLKDHYDCQVCGIEPSHDAIVDGGKDTVIVRGVADSLPFASASFDLVIFGFCLYVCDPAALFRIAAEADRVLSDHGLIVIHDFADTASPFARKYRHCDGVLAYHMDYAKLWLAHPWYRRACRRVFDDDAVTVLQKRTDDAFLVLPPDQSRGQA